MARAHLDGRAHFHGGTFLSPPPPTLLLDPLFPCSHKPPISVTPSPDSFLLGWFLFLVISSYFTMLRGGMCILNIRIWHPMPPGCLQAELTQVHWGWDRQRSLLSVFRVLSTVIPLSAPHTREMATVLGVGQRGRCSGEARREFGLGNPGTERTRELSTQLVQPMRKFG